LIFYPFTVKIMLKMHQKPFGSGFKCFPRPPSRNMGPTSKGRGREERRIEGEERRREGTGGEREVEKGEAPN